MLRPAAHVRFDLQLDQPVVQLEQEAVEVLLALRRLRVDQLLDLRVPLRVHDGEGEVLELPLHVADAEPVREGA